MALIDVARLKEKLVKALTPWFLGREQDALIEAMKTAGEETLLAVDVDTAALQAQFTNLYSNAGADAVGTASGNSVEEELALKIPLTQKATALGVATLGADGKLVATQLPDITITDTSAVASQAAMLALVAQKGDVAVRTDINKTFILAADPATVLGNWVEIISPTAAVSSVFGRVGVVTAQTGDYTVGQVTGAAPIASPTFTGTVSGVTKSMVGLGNVDNTSDANKPVSTAQATALSGKVGTTGNYTISGNNTFTAQQTVSGTTINFRNWGSVGTDGLVLLGDNSYLWKTGAQFQLYNATGAWDLTFNAGGTNWSSGNFNPATKYTTVGGGGIGPSANNQGFEIHWNAVTVGGGRNEYINDFGGGTGGHYFYTRSLNTDAPVLRQIFYPDGRVEFGGNFFAGNKLKGGAWPSSTQYCGIFHADMATTDYVFISGGAFDPNTYISTMPSSGGNVIIRPNGNILTYETWFTSTGIESRTPYYHITANASRFLRVPRTFVQAADPGAEAADGDLWFW